VAVSLLAAFWWPRLEEGRSAPDHPMWPEEPATPPVAEEAPPAGPRVAIVFDDLGGQIAPVERLLATGEALTFSVLPFLAHSQEVATLAHEAGREVLLHLPMEPQGYPQADPGEGALFTDLPVGELHQRLADDLQAVPYIDGVNNHMGSRFTEDPEAMAVVMEGLRQAGLFFLDSRTTPHSVGPAAAAEMGVPWAARDVFLDHDRAQPAVARQIERLITLAIEHGSAIAIGHPHPETLAALEEALPGLREAGVTIVPLSELVLLSEGEM
jgi:hypothetical protein